MNMQLLRMVIPFAGFYASAWDDAMDSELDALVIWLKTSDSRFEDYPDADIHDAVFAEIDWDTVREALARAYADAFWEWLRPQLAVSGEAVEWRYAELVSPREYNGLNDRIFVNVSPALVDALVLQTDGATLGIVIKDRFTSRSGFVSFYSNDMDDWFKTPVTQWDHNQLGTLLLAWMETVGADVDFRERCIMEDLWYVFSDAMAVSADAVYARLAGHAAHES